MLLEFGEVLKIRVLFLSPEDFHLRMGRQTCLEVGCVPQGHVVTKHFPVFYSVHLEYNKAKTSSVQEIYNINNRALLFKMNEPVQTLTWVLAGELRKATCSKPSGPRRPAVQKLRRIRSFTWAKSPLFPPHLKFS